MSVGYDLKGIQTPRVQAFIASMRSPGAALDDAIRQVAKVYPPVRDLAIPTELSNHITLSTMHGCPPAEIERIARFLLKDVGVHTWVKLNPTLLGPERLRGLLNRTQGFDIEVPDSAFEHDPKFEEAAAMVRNLAEAARDLPVGFGLKLTNTLEVVNHRPVFPASEKMMYLSGRALHPLTLSLAQLLSEELEGCVVMSFCGGADAGNFAQLVADGLGPVTVCTDLLKPGGYARLQQYLVNLDAAMVAAGAESLDEYVGATSGGHGARFNLARHSVTVVGDEAYAQRIRPLEFKGGRPLKHFDCIAAPCEDACPTHQNIPDYPGSWPTASPGRPWR
jgi:putative selenate reductase